MKLPDELKRQAMDAINDVNTIKQMGMLKTLGMIALYSALIHQRDNSEKITSKARKDAVGREI
ncbi:MAG: hypothetical protein WBN75_11350 [Verrucomicrobiia bacterium]